MNGASRPEVGDSSLRYIFIGRIRLPQLAPRRAPSYLSLGRGFLRTRPGRTDTPVGRQPGSSS